VPSTTGYKDASVNTGPQMKCIVAMHSTYKSCVLAAIQMPDYCVWCHTDW
jgi:hypothetical protein